jgi:chromatin assembly factor 1 subunit B
MFLSFDVFRGSTSEMYDIAWSPDELFIISANMDNSARIYSIQDQRCIHVLTDHSHFVQGVAWDPKSMFLATQSSDRYSI